MMNLLRAKRVVWGLMFVLMTSVALLSYFAGGRYIASERAVEEALTVQAAIDATRLPDHRRCAVPDATSSCH
jgi:hypothetical protein